MEYIDKKTNNLFKTNRSWYANNSFKIYLDIFISVSVVISTPSNLQI